MQHSKNTPTKLLKRDGARSGEKRMKRYVDSGGNYFEPIDNNNIITKASNETTLKIKDFFVMQFSPLLCYLKSSGFYLS